LSLKYSSTRILHDDHMATIALLTEVERVVLGRQAAPAQDDQTGRFIDRLCKAMDGEISGHFDFEEASVFPMLAEYGMADLGDLLVEEHHVLRNVMNDIVAGANLRAPMDFHPRRGAHSGGCAANWSNASPRISRRKSAR
jgi:hemerythrin-like domain-containing protein